MKRFWLVLLSLGLIVAFSTSAMAVDVKFSGSYYVAGMYQDKTSLDKLATPFSTAFFYERLRVQTEFVVSPGLSLITRFDAMERVWGGQRSSGTQLIDTDSAGTVAENQNIAFDLAYISYASPIGIFLVGYMEDKVWGTSFGDNSVPEGCIQYMVPVGSFIIGAKYVKLEDKSNTAFYASTNEDYDLDRYNVFAVYKVPKLEVGLLGFYLRDARNSKTSAGYKVSAYALEPYVKTQVGPVKIQAEVDYAFGDLPKMDNSALNTLNKTLSALAFMVDATADLGIVYFGGTAAYVSGDDPGTSDKAEGSMAVINGGYDWNPSLILWNRDRAYWAGAIGGAGGSSTTQDVYNAGSVANAGMPYSQMYNAWFLQGRVGVKPIDKLNILASVSWAVADKKPSQTWVANDYGYEVDLTATYKITNNLSYMLGVGYLFTGAYFKGTDPTATTTDDFLIINKLTLTF